MSDDGELVCVDNHEKRKPLLDPPTSIRIRGEGLHENRKAADTTLTSNAGFALVAVFISIIDAPIDVAFIANIAPGPAGKNHEIINDFYAAFCTLMLAVAANFLILCYFLKTEASNNPAFSPWLWRHRSYVHTSYLCYFSPCSSLTAWRCSIRDSSKCPRSLRQSQSNHNRGPYG
jgi:hypothetical protein